MRSLAVLVFVVFAVSKFSFAEEVVRFCVGNPKIPESFCQAYESTVIFKFPHSMLAAMISGKIPSEKHWTKEEIYNEKKEQFEFQPVSHYWLGNKVDAKVFRNILYWMETGDTALIRQRFPMETLLIHADYLQLPELTEALLGKGSETAGQFVKIPGGTYDIGNLVATDPNAVTNERRHSVTLSEYEISETAVTQENYVIRTGKKNPSTHNKKEHCPNSFKEIELEEGKTGVCMYHPVENVNWHEAKEYAQLESDNDPRYTYNLPTEAQQEVAFRGKTATIYVSGDDAKGVDEFAWHKGNSEGQTHPVKSRVSNSFGVYRSGVWEWGLDWYRGEYEYEGANGLDPGGPASGSNRVVRGGCWNSDVESCRSAFRNGFAPSYRCRYGIVGFRLVRTPRYPQ